ncbi:transposase [Plakobranchus ocellatus]|uniref:Transposase n=1 Tax=Plakobranchus ocellatus TaxID=259542 RepID=A0AAV4D3Q5_9GAST|nr:transposase [Plakobranchus ocellatus]
MYGCGAWTFSKQIQNKLEATEMWFLRRMLRIPWTAKKTNERVLNEANKRRSLVRTIRKRQATFLGHVMRRGKLEHLVTIGTFEEKRSRGKQREKIITLDRLKEAIRRKRPGLLRRGVVLQHDNATPHSANLTQQWLQRYGWEILPHPAHSPDLAPSDFHLFGPLKRHLGGMAFETEDDLISKLRNWFDNLDVDFFRVGINSLLSRWQKCIDLHGDYVEK